MKYCHFSGNFRLMSARFVFEKPNKEPEYSETVDITELSNPDKSLRSEYEAAKSEVEKRLKNYESKPNYKPFVEYAKGRLAQCDKDLKQYDVLDPKQIRENLAKLRTILFKARQDEVNDEKDEVVAAINERKKYYLDMLAKRLKEQEDQLADMPDTLALAKKLNGAAVFKVSALFSDRVRMVSQSVVKQMSGVGDLDTMAFTTLWYLNGIKVSLTSETDVGSANMEAKKLYEDYDAQVTGEYLHEKARSGDVAREIRLTSSQGRTEKDKDGKSHMENVEYKEANNKMEADYLKAVESCKGEDKYKKVAVIYGDFLDKFNVLRDKYFPDEKVKGRPDYRVSALARTNAIRSQWEKGWEKSGVVPSVVAVVYVPEHVGVTNTGVSLHIGPEDPELAGIVTGMVRSGTNVNVAEGEPIKVNGVEYVKIQVLDNKGKAVNEGWVTKQSITSKFGVKPEKAVEKRGSTV